MYLNGNPHTSEWSKLALNTSWYLKMLISKSRPFNWLLSRKKFRQELKLLDEFLQPYIQRTLSLSAAELDEKLTKRCTFLESLAGSTKDAKFIRDQLLTVLLAGRDTTASTLSICLFELSRHPSVLQKLRSELEARLGLGAEGKKPTYADLREMTYLNAMLNETMRLYPVVPLNLRNSLHDTTLPRGGGPDGQQPIGVPGNTLVLYSTLLMQKRADLYAAPGSVDYFDPGKFLPERWLSGWVPRPWEFIPFNKGPRSCIGQEFAVVEIKYTVVRILQAFEKIVAFPATGKEEVEDPKFTVEVTMSPDVELNCMFLRKEVGRGKGDF